MARVKICGIRTRSALEAAAHAGAAYVGLVFFARSPRAVSTEAAAALADEARRLGLTVVALLVDADDALLSAIVGCVRPDILQLHGAETPDRCRAIRARHGTPVWKAASVRTRQDVRAAEEAYALSGAADLLLFDAKPPEGAVLPGGNGLAFDWHILDEVRGRMPFALAGGLTPDNVAAAIQLVRPAVVDVSSGVESAPGIKDDDLIRRFLTAANTGMEGA